jgi:hypothetical protein
MIRPMFWGALAGACLFVLFLISLPFTQAAEARGLHPLCNIDWPCVAPTKPAATARAAGSDRREVRQVRPADRFRNVEFGSPMYPPETARSFLSKDATILPHPEG